jgi:signal peptidase I
MTAKKINPTDVLKDGAEMLRVLHKNRVYEQDLLRSADLEKILNLEERWKTALKEKNAAQAAALAEETFVISKRAFKPSPWGEWRENVEVFVVAIVIALAIRSFFLQPFKIPTGSMEPTLNGQQLTVTDEAPRNLLLRLALLPFTGSWHTRVELPEGGVVRALETRQYTPLFEFTDVTIGYNTHRFWATADALRKIGVREGEQFPAGSVINFKSEAGDQVLVNKVALNFRPPKRGEVFVFKTTDIRFLELFNRQRGIENSQYYIKRCVGVPGDTLQLDAPYLKVNGQNAQDTPVFERIYSRQNGYSGYVNEPRSLFLRTPQEIYNVQKDFFWAMGDNSPNSLDSRYWGPVPRQNLVGTGWVVYWPFTAHWGWIR